jgi:hypothetical protein
MSNILKRLEGGTHDNLRAQSWGSLPSLARLCTFRRRLGPGTAGRRKTYYDVAELEYAQRYQGS